MQSHPTSAIVHAALIDGGTARAATVHALAHEGSPTLRVCGMRQRAAEETSRRINEALASSGLPTPMRDVAIDINPGPLEEEHPELDLPIALAALVACDHLIQAAIAGVGAVGELRPSGAVTNAFPLGSAIDAVSARTALVPAGHLTLPSRPGTEIIRVASVREAVEVLCERTHTVVTSASPIALAEEPSGLADLTGLLTALDDAPANSIAADERGGRLWRPRLVLPSVRPRLRRTGG